MSSLKGIRTLNSPDGSDIWPESVGDVSKPAIVFVHGLAGNGTVWKPQFSDAELLKNFHLVRYDLRGHGRSAKPVDQKDYESARFAEDFKTVCDAFGVVKPFVAGWSVGAAIPVDVVTAYGADYISGLIYVGGPIPALHYHPQIRPPFIDEAFPKLVSRDSNDLTPAASLFVDICFPRSRPLPFEEKLTWMGSFVMQPPMARFWSIMRVQDHTVWEKSVKHLPVIVIQGTEDMFTIYEPTISLIKRVFDNVEVKTLEGVGHTPHYEVPEVTNRYINEWMKKVTGSN